MSKFAGFTPPTSNYTIIPDELFDKLLGELSGNEFKIISYIARHTWGYKKNADTISLNQFQQGIKKKTGDVVDKGVGLSRNTIINSLRLLEKRGVITVVRQKNEKGAALVNLYALRMKCTGQATTPGRENNSESGNPKGSAKNEPGVGQQLNQEVVQNLDPQDTTKQEKNNNKQGVAETKTEIENKIKILSGCGFDKTRLGKIRAGGRLILEYPLAEIEQAARYVQEKNRGNGISNFPGYVINVLENGYQNTSLEAISQAKLERLREKSNQKHDRVMADQHQRQQERRKIKKRFAAWCLAHPHEFNRLRQEAAATVPEVLRDSRSREHFILQRVRNQVMQKLA